MDGGGGPSRRLVWRRGVIAQVGLLTAAAVVAVTAYAVSGDWVPWLWAAGTLVVLVLLGARQRWGPAWTAAAALVVADVIWLSAMPWWAWLLTLVAAVVGVLVWLVRGRRVPATHPSVITMAVVGVAGLVTGMVGAVLHIQARAEQAAQEAAAQRQESVSRILPHSPTAVADYLARTLAENDPTSTCFAFTPEAAATFAAAHGEPDCESAARTLAGRIDNPVDYQNNFWVPGSQQDFDGDTVTVRVCDIDVGSTGPRSLGILIVEPHRGGAGGFEITAWRPCP